MSDTVAVGPRYVARVSRIETFRCGPVGVSGAVWSRENAVLRREPKQMPRLRRKVS
jgi:uncharacterized membrane protein